MERIIGGFLVLAGIALIAVRERFIRANAASSRVFFGRWDPYSRWPRAARAYSLFLVFLVGGGFIIFGGLIALAVVETR